MSSIRERLNCKKKAFGFYFYRFTMIPVSVGRNFEPFWEWETSLQWATADLHIAQGTSFILHQVLDHRIIPVRALAYADCTRHVIICMAEACLFDF